MATSLKNGITPDWIANNFIMQWKSPGFANKVLILVEGKDDRLFYYKFFNHNTTEIVDCKGCKKVVEVYKILQRDAGFLHITIKDSDFDRLNGNSRLGNNFFYADCHDYEMMCLKNKSTVESLFENLGIPYLESMITQVFSDLEYLSYFKWYNFTNHYNYNFRAFSVTDKSSDDLCRFSHIHTCILPASPQCRPINETELKQFICSKGGCDPFELTNGHDFIKRLCFYIKSTYREWINLNEEKLKSTLHPCYTKDDFAESDLCHDIQIWEVETKQTVLPF